jgi:hypothetical protein
MLHRLGVIGRALRGESRIAGCKLGPSPHRPEIALLGVLVLPPHVIAGQIDVLLPLGILVVAVLTRT